MIPIVVCSVKHSLEETVKVKIAKTERVDKKYLIYTENGVYENTDTFCYMKFNSSDLYGKLSTKVGKEVTVKVTGLRIPILSMYKNIVQIKDE
jgi:hypothetical protein